MKKNDDNHMAKAANNERPVGHNYSIPPTLREKPQQCHTSIIFIFTDKKKKKIETA